MISASGRRRTARREKKHGEFVEPDGVARLHRTPGAPAGGLVHAGEEGRLRPPTRHPPHSETNEMQILDRRLNPERQDPRANRQRFLRRAKAVRCSKAVHGGVREAGASPASLTREARSSMPDRRGIDEPRLPSRSSSGEAFGTRCCPATSEFAEGDTDSHAHPAGSGGGSAPMGSPRRRWARTTFRFVLSREEFRRPVPRRSGASRPREAPAGRHDRAVSGLRPGPAIRSPARPSNIAADPDHAELALVPPHRAEAGRGPRS